MGGAYILKKPVLGLPMDEDDRRMGSRHDLSVRGRWRLMASSRGRGARAAGCRVLTRPPARASSVRRFVGPSGLRVGRSSGRGAEIGKGKSHRHSARSVLEGFVALGGVASMGVLFEMRWAGIRNDRVTLVTVGRDGRASSSRTNQMAEHDFHRSPRRNRRLRSICALWATEGPVGRLQP